MHPVEQINVIIGRIYRSGMTTTSGGNVSIRDDNGDIWITPSGVDKGSLTPKDIMCVKKDGTVIGPHKPSSELPFHKAIYETRPELTAIIHAHPPALVAFSIAHKVPDTKIIPQAITYVAISVLHPMEHPAVKSWERKLPANSKTPSIKQ